MAELVLPERPKLNRRFRLQWEDARQCHVLLYPEGMVQLNTSAAEILRRCDGEHTVAELVAGLEQQFNATGLLPQVETFLQHACAQQWVL